jgi:hypothetical protein
MSGRDLANVRRQQPHLLGATTVQLHSVQRAFFYSVVNGPYRDLYYVCTQLLYPEYRAVLYMW